MANGNSMDKEEGRLSGRVSATIPIQLAGADTLGQQFLENSKTLTLSRYGASIFSTRKLAPEQEIIIHRTDTNKEADVYVVGMIREESGGHIYAVGFVDPEADLWEIEFPTTTNPAVAGNCILLICSACHSSKVVPLGELAYGIIDIDQGVLQYCKKCRVSTKWIPSPGETTASSVKQPAESERESALLQRTEERRKYARTKTVVRACVRIGGTREEVVCENISRGGLCFKSQKPYSEGSSVEVAVPFSRQIEPIFVPAKIIYIQNLAGEGLVRCGLAYVTEAQGKSQY
jgi:hypothetical protein